jgi:hypothetical protein
VRDRFNKTESEYKFYGIDDRTWNADVNPNPDKPEIRIPKSETNSKSEIQITKTRSGNKKLES